MNADKILHGRDHERDAPLSARGRMQAEALARRLRARRFDAAVGSELRRSQETLEIVVKEHEGITNVLPPNASFNEMHYGDLDGRKLSEVLHVLKSVASQWHLGHENHALPMGESPDEVAGRYVNELKELMGRYDSVLVVSHALANKVTLASLDARGEGGNYGAKINALPQENACINEIVVSCENNGAMTFEVVCVNDVGHLFIPRGGAALL